MSNQKISEIYNVTSHDINKLINDYDIRYKEYDYDYIKSLIDNKTSMKNMQKECGCGNKAMRTALLSIGLYEYYHIKNNTLDMVLRKKTNHKCIICGAEEKDNYDVKKYNGEYYCKKHYNHMYRYGKIINKTIYDKNDYVENGEYIQIILRDKKQSENGRCIIDKEFYDKVKNYKWYLSFGYCKTKGINKHSGTCIQDLIMDNLNKKHKYDHINKKKLDNIKHNLRKVTSQQNAMNMGKKHTNTSGVTGVALYKNDRVLKWDATITYKYKNIFLGRFISFDEAVHCRLKGEIEYFKEYSPNYNKDTNTIQITYISQDDNKEKYIEYNLDGNLILNIETKYKNKYTRSA